VQRPLHQESSDSHRWWDNLEEDKVRVEEVMERAVEVMEWVEDLQEVQRKKGDNTDLRCSRNICR
jgi:hypothetical protein